METLETQNRRKLTENETLLFCFSAVAFMLIALWCFVHKYLHNGVGLKNNSLQFRVEVYHLYAIGSWMVILVLHSFSTNACNVWRFVHF